MRLWSRAQELQLLSPHAAITEVHRPRAPCSETGEATTMRSLRTAIESNPCSAQIEKTPHSNEDSAQPKQINTEIKLWNGNLSTAWKWLVWAVVTFVPSSLTSPDKAGIHWIQKLKTSGTILFLFLMSVCTSLLSFFHPLTGRRRPTHSSETYFSVQVTSHIWVGHSWF